MIERWIVAGVIVATSLYALRGFWSEWRGKSLSDAHRAPEWWPVDLLWWRALVRSGPAGTIEGPLVAAGYVVSGPGQLVRAAADPGRPGRSRRDRTSAHRHGRPS
jgi:hypothetical protein